MNLILTIAFFITTVILMTLVVVLYSKRKRLSIMCGVFGTLSLIGLFLSIWNLIVSI